MRIEAVKTHPIRPGENLEKILDRHLTQPPERSVIAVTSKIVSLCQNRVVKIGEVDKHELIHQEAEFYIPATENKYGITLSIKDGILIPSAGIDESNGDGYYILWPHDAQGAANSIRVYLVKRFSLKEVGVVITDSKTTPLRRGTTGVAVSHSGFAALKNYVGKPDIFGRKMHVTQSNIMDGLAATAVLAMGEGKETTPLAVLTELSFAEFIKHHPKAVEREMLRIPISEDLYEPLVNSGRWQAGGCRQ